ncbi:MAG: LysM peptidoglycan-binding domain-containing protein [Gammaproteobacteria bacterium]|nr:LysM peptidoglycan-binding domain-containing protein [Gammaproteobacteria bacterium]
MKSVTLAKLLAVSIATVGLIAGCGGAETKDDPVEQPVKQEAEAKTEAAADNNAMQSSVDETNQKNSAASASYEVVSGDNLWNISGKNEIYSDPYQWPLIYKANRDKIKDADLIYSGQTLEINRSASQSDMDAATRHAKTRGAWTLGEQESSDKAYLSE